MPGMNAELAADGEGRIIAPTVQASIGDTGRRAETFVACHLLKAVARGGVVEVYNTCTPGGWRVRTPLP